MPQLDPIYFLSQITWLLVFFSGFFCISKFLILPKLEKILQNRSNIIETNTNFAKEILQKAKTINENYDLKIQDTQNEIDQKIDVLVKELKEKNGKKINDLKKKLNEEENENFLQMKNEIESIKNELNNNITDIVVELIHKLFSIKINKEEIKKFL